MGTPNTSTKPKACVRPISEEKVSQISDPSGDLKSKEFDMADIGFQEKEFQNPAIPEARAKARELVMILTKAFFENIFRVQK